MGDKVFVIVKINPKDMEKLEETELALKKVKSGELKDTKRQALGFGVEIIKAGFLINEKETGALERLQKELDEIESIESAEIEGMTLV